MNETEWNECVRLAYAFANDIGGLSSEREFPFTDRNVATAASVDLCLEHFGSVIILLEQRRFASAAALIRPMFDALVLAVGLDDGEVVTQERITGLLEGSLERPKLEVLIGKLCTKRNELAPALRHIQSHALASMHDYTHGGSRQLTRRIQDGMIGSNTCFDEGLEMVSVCSLIAMIASYLALSRHGTSQDIASLTEAYERVSMKSIGS